jgi:cephalosporin-C deacetylase-like acetyl esterase
MSREDVWNFWEQTRTELAKVDLEAVVEPVEQSDVFTMEGRVKTRTIHRVILSSFEGRRIRAWYVLPAGQPPARASPPLWRFRAMGALCRCRCI